jgi:hypothetical protein
MAWMYRDRSLGNISFDKQPIRSRPGPIGMYELTFPVRFDWKPWRDRRSSTLQISHFGANLEIRVHGGPSVSLGKLEPANPLEWVVLTSDPGTVTQIVFYKDLLREQLDSLEAIRQGRDVDLAFHFWAEAVEIKPIHRGVINAEGVVVPVESDVWVAALHAAGYISGDGRGQ